MTAQTERPIQLQDIAKQTGYSIATVSKVLNGKSDVSDKTRSLIEHALQRNGYAKRMPTTKNRKLIEVVFQNFENIWSLEILRGIIAEAREHGLSVVTTESGDRTHPDATWINGVIQRQPLGVVLIFSDLTQTERDKLQSCHIDYATFDPAGDPSPNNLSVQADNWTGGLIATRHLLDLGHTNIGIITGPMSMMCAKARLDGYKAALEERHIEFRSSNVREGDFRTEGGYQQALNLLHDEQTRPTAIFASSDLMAMGVYEAARTLRLRIPEDLSVIGFDDVQTSAFMGPSLTTVRQPLQEMASAAVRLIVDKTSGKAVQNHTVFPTNIVQRNSTMRYDRTGK